jgi:hypothetical protein
MDEFGQVGKFLVIAGLIIAAVGILISVGPKINLFNLPGDISFGGKNWKVFIPIGTGLLISAVLTLILWLINRFK